ncbi:TonB-dependent receptor [Gluconacetobacter sacchari]|uniref:TonB-dependent receptor n=1 Tax=Gluconacetobacter sacchari TaxID=92759 RepID=UPI0039B556CA
MSRFEQPPSRRQPAGFRAWLMVTCLGMVAAAPTHAAAPKHKPAARPHPAAPAPAAQDAKVQSVPAGPQIEQVTVTVQQVRSNMQRTPIAVTAISGTALDQSNITQPSDLNGLVPSLSIAKTAGFETNVTIRGVGSQTPENALVAQSGVALYTDGVFIANTISLDQTLFDVDQVEVLRGPQGALYGQSSTGGALVINTRQPELGRFHGMLEGSGGNYGMARGRAIVNIPMGRHFAIRASFQQYDHSDYAHSTYGFGLDGAQTTAGKITALWRPVENFSAALTAQWYGATNTGAEQKNILDATPGARRVAQDYPSRFNLHTQLYHLNLNWRLPWATLTSVTAYQHLNNFLRMSSSRYNYDALGYYDNDAAWQTTMHTYTEELSLHSAGHGPLSWTGGVFLLGQRSSQFVAEFEGTTPPGPLSFIVPSDIMTNPPSNLSYGNKTTVSRFTVAPYVQFTYNITPKLHLTGGARYNYDHFAHYDGNFSAFGSSSLGNSFRTSEPTWKAELDYDLSHDNMLYFDVATGYKPGGVNGNPDSKVVGLNFQPERNTTFELGSKNMFFNQNLRLNFAAFFSKYHNMQYVENDPYPYAYGIANIPNTEMWGLESEATWLTLGGRLRFDGNLTLEDGRVDSNYRAIDTITQKTVYATNAACAYGGQYYNPACWAAVEAAASNINGNTPPQMPHVQGSISAAYTWDVPYGKLLTRIQYIYRGPLQSRIYNNPLYDHTPAYNLWNFYASYKPDHTHWLFAVTCSNLGNFAGVNSRYTDPYGTGQTVEQYVPPRQIFGTLSYSF